VLSSVGGPLSVNRFTSREKEAGDTPDPRQWSANISCRCGADPEGVAKAAEMLIAGERPAIIVGQGVRHGGAAAELLQLAGRLQIPVGASERARRDRLSSSAVAWPRVARRALPGERRDAPRVRLCAPTASPMATSITP
jgi:hypothetical protein